MQAGQPPLAKVLVVGASAAGKTSLVNRLVFNEFYEVAPTVGVNFAQKVCAGVAGPLNLSIWDLSGQDRFRFIMPQLCTGAAGVVLVFDQTQPTSLEAAAEWLALTARHANPSHQQAVVLVGAKADLEPTLKPASISRFCSLHNITTHIDCSSKTGSNVRRVFETVASAIQLSHPNRLLNADLVALQRGTEKGSVGCETPTPDR